MRVLHLVKTAEGATWAERQMRELVKLGLEIHVVLPNEGRLAKQYKKDNIIVHYLNLNFLIKHYWLLPRMVRDLKKLIEQVKPDLVHSHFVNTTLVARFALKKSMIPLLFQVPGPLHLENTLIGKLETLTARKMDYWCSSSKYTFIKYKKIGIKDERIFYAPYSVEVSKFRPKKKLEARKDMGYDENLRIVGMVAYFYPPRLFLGYTRGIKGHEDLIDAIALCLKNKIDLYCLMVGGPYGVRGIGYMNRVKAYAQKKCGTRIRFLGEQENIPNLISCFDVAVVPSLSENYGGVIESLLMEIPTIGTAVGGIPEIIKHFKTGFLVPKKSPEMISKVIEYIFNNEKEAKEIAKEGRKAVLEMFEPESTAKNILNIYRYILE